jgi:dTDP-6-deoxy-L-talose 4-dehydrogenase (NAD+)
MIRVAVTGAAGFVGRHVLNELNRDNEIEVMAIARPGATALPPVSNGRWINIDLAAPTEDSFVAMGSPDVLLHLAWNGLPNYHSLHHFESELPRQYLFLRQLIAAGLPSLVVAGTCLEYGMQSGPLTEDTQTLPANPYAFAKDVLRRQLEFLQQSMPFTLTWTRLFYVYGSGQNANSLWPQLCEAVHAGKPEFNMSGGAQLRDYLPIEIVARCLAQLAMQRRNHGVINVCSGQPTSVRTLVEGWIRSHQWNIQLNLGYYPYPDYEPMAFWGDCSKLEAILNLQWDSGHESF